MAKKAPAKKRAARNGAPAKKRAARAPTPTPPADLMPARTAREVFTEAGKVHPETKKEATQRLGNAAAEWAQNTPKEWDAKHEAAVEARKVADALAMEATHITLEIPVKPNTQDYCASHVNMHMSRRQRGALRAILDGFNITGRKPQGRPRANGFRSGSEVVKEILDMVADKMEK